MQAHIDAARTKEERLRLIHRYGWGVPTERRVIASGSNSVTLIIQDEFLPFELGNSGITMRALRLHRLPWPEEQLRDLFGAKVRMRVTLSYFVEPNPSSRGWQGRYRYASHGLRFDVKRPTESLDQFQLRISNEAAQEEARPTPRSSSPDDRWEVGTRTRNVGSLHADIWTGRARSSPTAASSASLLSAAGGRTASAATESVFRFATRCLSPYGPKP